MVVGYIGGDLGVIELDSPGRPGREALVKTTNVCAEIHFDRVSSTL